jgi:hypothetical protein
VVSTSFQQIQSPVCMCVSWLWCRYIHQSVCVCGAMGTVTFQDTVINVCVWWWWEYIIPTNILLSVCACSGGGEYTVLPSIVIKVSMWWRCLLNLLYYCHQCVRVWWWVHPSNKYCHQCVRGVVVSVHYSKNTHSSVCVLWWWVHHSNKYWQQCVRVMVVSTSFQQILTAMCAWGDGSDEYIALPNVVISVWFL